MQFLLNSPATTIFMALFLGCMVVAAARDLTSYTIPNSLSLVLIAGFLACGAWQGLGIAVIGSHLGAGLLLLAIGYVLFVTGVVGGGDAKFMAASGLWIGWHNMLSYIVVFSLAGGVLVLLLLLFRRIKLPGGMSRIKWIADLHNKENGVPYGIALAAGGVAVMPQLTIFTMHPGAAG